LADGIGIIRGNARKAGFDAADTQLVQFAGDFQLLLRREDDADGLLAVA
jgi:hypothetical protein